MLRHGRGWFAFLVLCGCSSATREMPSGAFHMCSRVGPHQSRLRIDYAELRAFSDDYGRPLSRCASGGVACIEYPFVLSVPPSLPVAEADVRWDAGPHLFSMTILDETAGKYEINVVTTAVQGRPVVSGRQRFIYTSDEGIIAFSVHGGEDYWVRCGGRLTFDDLQAVSDELGRNGS